MANNVCVVVGAGSGLGVAIARRFGREGMRVALVARQEASKVTLQVPDSSPPAAARTFFSAAGMAAAGCHARSRKKLLRTAVAQKSLANHRRVPIYRARAARMQAPLSRCHVSNIR